MERNAPSFRRLAALAMKYMVKTTNDFKSSDKAECLVCGWSCPPGFRDKELAGAGFYLMESHIEAHIECDEITEDRIRQKLSGGAESPPAEGPKLGSG